VGDPSDEQGLAIERTTDPSALTRLHDEPPWIAFLVAGVAWSGVGLALGFPWPWLVGATVVIAIVVWAGIAWLPGRPGQRMRRYILGRSRAAD
jgi:uncharacterized membrane protein AbrB (regulator of aidB expression)